MTSGIHTVWNRRALGTYVLNRGFIYRYGEYIRSTCGSEEDDEFQVVKLEDDREGLWPQALISNYQLRVLFINRGVQFDVQ